MRPLNLVIDAIIRLVPLDFPADFVVSLNNLKALYSKELTAEEWWYYDELCFIFNNHLSTVNAEWANEALKILNNEIDYRDVLNA